VRWSTCVDASLRAGCSTLGGVIGMLGGDGMHTMTGGLLMRRGDAGGVGGRSESEALPVDVPESRNDNER
jgi:hypothetical protein